MIRILACLVVLALAACASGNGVATNGADDMLTPAPSLDHPGDDGPNQLLHLADTDVRQMLGEPEFVWVEAGAEMWRYRGQGCFVDVFLYPDQGVTFVDVHGDDLDSYAREACYRSLVKPAAG